MNKQRTTLEWMERLGIVNEGPIVGEEDLADSELSETNEGKTDE